jgi:hypothetical protein
MSFMFFKDFLALEASFWKLAPGNHSGMYFTGQWVNIQFDIMDMRLTYRVK